jgi:peptide/nickel transport system permease protein
MNVGFVAKKVGQALLTLFLASIVVFLGVRALPGDPAAILAGEAATPEVIAAIRTQYGFDQPLIVQYWRFLTSALHGDFGTSLRNGKSVSELIGQTLPVTLQLALCAVIIAAVIGICFGVIGAYWKGRWPASIPNGLAVVGLSIPHFWTGMLGILVLSVEFGWLPASGYVSPLADPLQALRHFAMPAFILSMELSAVLMRHTRSSMFEALNSEYVLASRAKGVGEFKVVVGHALRNSMLVVTTVFGLQLGGLIGGVVITERLFGLPGFGKLTIDAISQRDFPVIEGVVLVVAAFYVLINLIVDMLYSVMDPRVRVGGNS